MGKWVIEGFDSTKPIYREEVEADLPRIKEILRGLVRRHLTSEEARNTELLHVHCDRANDQLTAGENPHYVAHPRDHVLQPAMTTDGPVE